MESQKVECKKLWRDDWLATLCAFANGTGGILRLGINDDESIEGLENISKLLEDIPSKINNFLGIIAHVDHKNIDGKDVLNIRISPSSIPISYRGRIYVRMGSTTQILSGAQLNDFLSQKTGKSWLGAPETNANWDDIDANSVYLFRGMAANRMPSIQKESDIQVILSKLHLLEDQQLTRAAILLFGKRPCKFIPGAFTLLGLFEDETNVLQTVRFEDNLMVQSQEITAQLRLKFIPHRHQYEGVRRVDQLAFPEEAIREMIMNALIHRDFTGAHTQIKVYPDRIITWNAGGLISGISLESLKGEHSSIPRNPLIASVFFKAGLIETWGRGTNKIVHSCLTSGLPEPQFQEVSGGFQIVLRENAYSETYLRSAGLNERQIKAMDYLKGNQYITNTIYQKLSEVSRNTSTRDIQELVEKGILKQIGTHGAGVKYTLI